MMVARPLDAPVPIGAQPVVLIGAPRSGTNLLRDLICRLPGCATWPCDEINYVWRRHHAAAPTDEQSRRDATPAVKNFVRRRFADRAQRSRADFVIEKTCANSLRVEFVDAILPEAKFVFLTRCGRDVVASARERWQAPIEPWYLMQKLRFVPWFNVPGALLKFVASRRRVTGESDRRLSTWGPRFSGLDELVASAPLVEVCAEQWRRCVTDAAMALSRLPASRLLAVEFESLVTAPADELARIADYLGVETLPRHLRAATRDVRPDRVGAYRGSLTTDDMRRIEPHLERVAACPAIRRLTPYFAPHRAAA